MRDQRRAEEHARPLLAHHDVLAPRLEIAPDLVGVHRHPFPLPVRRSHAHVRVARRIDDRDPGRARRGDEAPRRLERRPGKLAAGRRMLALVHQVVEVNGEERRTLAHAPLALVGAVPLAHFVADDVVPAVLRAPHRSGSATVKVEPLPGVLSSRIAPPCSSTKRLVSARPRPVPSAFLILSRPTCLNSSNTAAWSSGAMPMPVSRTVTSSAPFCFRAETWTLPPSGVNFTALESRFSMICLNLRSSPENSASC